MRIILVVLALLLVLLSTPVLGHAGEEHAPAETDGTDGVSGMDAAGGIIGLVAVAGIGLWIWTRYGAG